MNNSNQICQTCYQRIDDAKVEPGEGYRLLTVGERRKPDDEFFVMGRGWEYMRALYVSTPLLINSAPMRRKVETPSINPDPGEGYRLLSRGEIRSSDDESFVSHLGWNRIRSCYVGNPVRITSRPTRRKIPVSNHNHSTDSGQRACPVCSGNAAIGHVVNPGFGYRLLEIGETIRNSDEAFDSETWKSFEDEGKIFDGKLFFFPRRRKIEMPPIQVFPGAGYRFLAPDERIEVGDEVWSSFVKEWTAFFSHVAGSPLNPGLTTRRRIPWALPDPGVGYRLLKVGEIRQRKDEFFVDGVWRGPTEDDGTPVSQFSWPYRRKISPKQYRLLSDGDMTNSTDEVWDDPSGDRPGVWRKLNWKFSVVRDTDPPVRREINSYIGGPA